MNGNDDAVNLGEVMSSASCGCFCHVSSDAVLTLINIRLPAFA